MDSLCLPGIYGSRLRSPSTSERIQLRLAQWGGYYAIGIDDAVLVDNGEKGGDAVEEGVSGSAASEGRSESWVMKILHVRSRWREQEASVELIRKANVMMIMKMTVMTRKRKRSVVMVAESMTKKKKRRFNSIETRFQGSYGECHCLKPNCMRKCRTLGTWLIPYPESRNSLKNHGLRFVTSSVEKREMTTKAEKEQGLLPLLLPICILVPGSILPFKSSKAEIGKDSDEGSNRSNDSVGIINSEVASFMATTDSVTAVVAAKEEVKQAVADDLNSVLTTPCEWFICDDDQTGTRFFVIQGSESLASWQANLLFEPISFEGLDVPVHRGIYEAAKGSMSRCCQKGVVPPSSLLPVITFGAPSIMCGGDHLLHELGLPRSHVQAVTMHRDIVPRAFSCNYPRHVAELLKAVNGNFRNHPCLNNQKVLYSPMGEFLILQPEEKHSPHHHLLPSGSGLYLLSRPVSDANDAERQLLAAKLELIRQEQNSIRKTKREQRRKDQFNFSGILQTGRESLKRFSRLVASQHMHLLVLSSMKTSKPYKEAESDIQQLAQQTRYLGIILAVVQVTARWMNTRFSTHKGFLIQWSHLQKGIRTGCPDAPSDGFVSHGEKEEYKSIGLFLGIKRLPGSPFLLRAKVSVGALSPYERLSETMVGYATVRDRGKVTRCGSWLLVVIAYYPDVYALSASFALP
ncbi:hypothetical protein CK203_017590 [Vitis vinifera]|uniref:Uncharacterized protein n=1 Tax=Vitis vinifera TaxID=29760 RepID=A0A438IXP9_VITVI|nr:hypothetical protein CK203_017590 [Vitis vinifera]